MTQYVGMPVFKTNSCLFVAFSPKVLFLCVWLSLSYYMSIEILDA